MHARNFGHIYCRTCMQIIYMELYNLLNAQYTMLHITQTKPVKKLVKSLSNPPLLERRFSHCSNTFPNFFIGFSTLRRSFCAKRELKMYHLLQKPPLRSSDEHSMNSQSFDSEEKRKQPRS